MRVATNPLDAAAWLDLGVLHELVFEPEEGLACQARALALERIFRMPAEGEGPGLRLLMFMAPGDMMTNVPLSFLLMHSDVTVYLAFLLPGQPLPEHIPEHDLALVGLGQAEASHAFLDQLENLKDWPCPILLKPAGIRSLERDHLWRVLEEVPGICIPPTIRVGRDDLEALANGESQVPGLPSGTSYPYIVRPLDSKAGQGLARIDGPESMSDYLKGRTEACFFISLFIDYSDPAGFFRKYRVTLIDGKPFICHMAVAKQWMLHYLNAGMDQDPAKRAEEAQVFATFDEDFAARHAFALKAIYERVGLEFFTLDCGETREGELLLFEADTAMVMHDMDSPVVYPYKAPQMQRVFQAFREFLERHAKR
jgi:hypothetical protein